jgi:predicted ester cyclase
MSVVQHKAIVRKFYDVVCNQRQFAVADEIFSRSYKMFPSSEPPFGPQGVKEFLYWLITTFPDVQYRVEVLVAEGDQVASLATLHGTPTTPIAHLGDLGTSAPTGKPFDTSEFALWQFADGKIVKRRVVLDSLPMLSSLGVFRSAAST